MVVVLVPCTLANCWLKNELAANGFLSFFQESEMRAQRKADLSNFSSELYLSCRLPKKNKKR